MKSHCLRPRPPPDPAPARPLPGIWWGAGAASSLGTDPEARLFTSPREALPHLSPSPLLPPTAAWENSCPPRTPESDRAVGAATVPTTGARFPRPSGPGVFLERGRRGTRRGP